MFIKALEYETVNPEQDDEGDTGKHFNPTTQQEKPNPAFNPTEYAAMRSGHNVHGGAGNVSENTGHGGGIYKEGPAMEDGRTLTPRSA